MTPNIISENEIARRIEREFSKIRHPHKQLSQIHRAIDLVRARVRESRAELQEQALRHPEIEIKADPLPVILIIGATGTAKSHVIKTYYEDVCIPEKWPPGKRYVFDFELSVDANKRQFQVDALTALKDPDPEKGNESVLRRRVAKITRKLETEIGFTDEVQHFIVSDTQKRTKSVGDAMKKIVNAGTFALTLLGTEAAAQLFDANQEFAERVDFRFELRGNNPDVAEERALFIDFIRTIRAGIEQREILSSAKTLEASETVGNLFLQVEGRLGTAVRVTKVALIAALQRGATTLLPAHYALGIARNMSLFGFKENRFASFAESFSDEMANRS